MQSGQASRTALGAAGHRAAHQVLEQGRIFADPLALRILGADAEEALAEAEREPARRGLRLFIAVRTRFAEDALAAAIARGASQLVVLGAGLDTYAYRADPGGRLRVFEVDHPATQAWKRERLASAGIAVPDALTFAPVDFEREGLAEGLAAAGFDPARRSFFTWLGVTPYLTEQAVFATLGFIAGLPGGGEVVFDYVNPPDTIEQPERRAFHEALAARVAAAGEAFRSSFDTQALGARLKTLGFREIEDLGAVEIAARYFPGHASPASGGGPHILRAAVR
ncbi:SAM-dependent methyltransferase [Methylocapsa sp. S129]|uniref:class I SAM-dependent methyltransferase n=1 Tax=Methylocapsa sp. S129 TaxID=1641869 RepID=UPI00131B8B7C|nr:SAM-dependent methyltransferase [Methylocapsa sp. S129]